MTEPEFLIAAIMLVTLIVYALWGGADFGGGVWDLLALGPQARAQREAIANAIAPVWEANHVWLILVIVLMFTAFPAAFAATMTTLFIPMTLVLIGIILRGSAFIFRKYGLQDDQGFRRWSTVFGVASLVTPFFLGASLGALSTGELQVMNGVPVNGFFAGWATPFALGCGLLAQVMFALLAAVYLTVDTKKHPVLQSDFRRRALAAEGVLILMAVLVFGLSPTGAPVVFEHLTSARGMGIAVLTILCGVGVFGGLWRHHFNLARAAAAGQVALILLGWGLGQYPYLVVHQFSIANAAGPRMTLRLVLVGLALGAVVLIPSMGYLFYIFKGSGDPLKIGNSS